VLKYYCNRDEVCAFVGQIVTNESQRTEGKMQNAIYLVIAEHLHRALVDVLGYNQIRAMSLGVLNIGPLQLS
jgi:hypothetical protein